MVGIDVVNIERLQTTLQRTSGLEARLFTDAELEYCRSKSDPFVHLAGTLAAKEAVIKALKLGSLMAWARRIEIDRDEEGIPTAIVEGDARAVAISIAHDRPVAVAIALQAEP